jgi:hypothetical protein
LTTYRARAFRFWRRKIATPLKNYVKLHYGYTTTEFCQLEPILYVRHFFSVQALDYRVYGRTLLEHDLRKDIRAMNTNTNTAAEAAKKAALVYWLLRHG